MPETIIEIPVNEDFGQLASHDSISRVLDSLKKNGITAKFVETSEEAKRQVLTLIPKDSQVMTMTSQTLETLGLTKEINESGNYQSVRAELSANGSAPQTLELKTKANLPDYVIGSVHAVTEDGQVLIASNTGSQLAAYVYGASHIIWVVGAQKLVKDLNDGLKRINEYSYPLEDRRAQKAYGIRSNVSKILIINKEVRPDRIHMVIVGEKLGF